MQEKLEIILFNFSREKCFVFGSYVIYSATYSLSIELKLFSSICFIVIFLVFFYNFCGLKTDRKWKWQGCELAIFRHLLAIFLLTKINSFHKIVVILKCQTYSKEYFPNLLETALLCQIFVFWDRDLKFWLQLGCFKLVKMVGSDFS